MGDIIDFKTGKLLSTAECIKRERAELDVGLARDAAEVEYLENVLRGSFSQAVDDACGSIDADAAERLYALQPDNPIALFSLAAACYADRQYAEAKDYMKRGVSAGYAPKEARLLEILIACDMLQNGLCDRETVGELMMDVFIEHHDDENVLEKLLYLALNEFEDPVTSRMFYDKGLLLNPQRFEEYESFVAELEAFVAEPTD